MKAKKRDTTQDLSQNGYSPIIKGMVSLLFNFLTRLLNDWENKFSTKNYKELAAKYDTLEKRISKDLQDMKARIETLTIKLFWTTLLMVILLICVIVQLILQIM